MSKILYAASTESHINNFHLDYINALRSEGHEVFVMAKGEGVDYNIPFEKKFFSPKNRECRKNIRKIIREENFDAILLNTSLAAFHIRLACPKKRPRIVNLVHGYLFSRHTGFIKTKILLFCEKFLRSKTDAIITMNRDDLNIANKNRLSKKGIYFTRGMGANMRPALRSRDDVRGDIGVQDSKMLLFAGELSGRKNQKFLIEAMPKIIERVPNAVLCLAGKGDKEEELRDLARGLGVESSVRFLGYRSDIPEIMCAADLYVSASVSEGMPFNIIEALGASLTVLASETKGQEDVIVNGESGFLYEFNNMDNYVSLCSDILLGKTTLKEGKAYERYLHYSKDEVFSETYGIIKSALMI